jgi:translocation and assembly module TamB
LRRTALLAGCLALGVLAADAQQPGGDDAATDDNGFILNLIQNQLSAPGRQIRLSGVTGALSSSARIAEITISDDEGVWLRIEEAQIDWSRAALLLGRVNVETLSAQRIDFVRRGVTPEPEGPRLPSAEVQPFTLPELPVSIRIATLDFPTITLGELVLGQSAELGVAGSLNLVSGALDTTLAIERRDGAGGQLDLSASFSNATRQLALDLNLQEPEGGLIATALNIENRPEIDLRVNGAGPLDALDVALQLDAGGDRLVDGTVALRERAAGLGFIVDVEGRLAPLIPPDFRGFFAGETVVHLDGVNKTAGGLRLDRLRLAGATLTLDGRLETGPDNFLQSLNLTGDLGDPRADPVTLPVPGARTQLHSATLHVEYGNARTWTGYLGLDRLVAGDIEFEDITLNMGGLAENLQDPATRSVTIFAEGLATGIWSEDPAIRAAIGNRIDFFADAGLPAGAPPVINQLQISGNGLSIFTAGSFEDLVYSGRHAVRIDDIASLSGIAGRELAGAVDVRAEGAVQLNSGGFDLLLDGGATNLVTGVAQLDPLLAGATTLAGRLARDGDGFRTEAFRIANDQVEITSSGRISSTETDIGFEVRLADLGLIDPRVSGPLTATGTARGLAGPIAVELSAAVPQGRLLDREIAGLALGFRGEVTGANVTGTVGGSGSLDGQVLALTTDIALVGTTRSVSDLDLTLGPNRLTGGVTSRTDEPLAGNLSLRAPDLAPLAALALFDAAGALDLDLTLDAGRPGQGVTLHAEGSGLRFQDNAIGSVALDARIEDALGVPLANGRLEAEAIRAAGIEIERLTATATEAGTEGMDFEASARLAIGTEAELAGSLERLPAGFAVTLDRLLVEQATLAARLAEPATVTLGPGTVDLTPLRLDVGTGQVEARGSVAETFDIDLAIRDLPLDLANAIQPALGVTGTVNGTARVTGPRDAPDVSFDLSGTGLGSTVVQAAGLPLLTVAATGRTQAGSLALEATLGSGEGLAADVTGSVPLGPGNLDLGVQLRAFPLVLIDRIAGNRGLAGSISGTARIGGPPANPTVAFDLDGSGLTARVLSQNGIAPFSVSAVGSYVGNAVSIGTFTATGPDGISLNGTGRIPFTGPGLDISASGTVPLGIADAFLAVRDAQASGTLRVNIAAGGSLAAPALSGTASIENGTLVDPRTNIRLDNVAADAVLTGQNVELRAFRASVAAGGTITASGRVSTNAAQGFPADLRIDLSEIRYTDGSFVTTNFSGNLAISGPITGGGGTVRGRIDLGATEISVAEGLGANAAATLEQVRHVRPRPAVRQTLERAQVGTPSPPQATGQSGLQLDVLITAPRQIFVRGRGLDVELGGELTLRGQATDLQPVGQFDLRRGRLDILGQRIDFDEGSLQLIGNLDPQIYFVARTSSGGTTAIVTVSGRVSSPEIVFSSEPPLPEDEVLALVIFNRSSQQLSPFQLAQLAAAAAELAGAGGNGLLAQLRGATGLADLDVVTEEDGATAVRAGAYLDDNVYLDVQTNTEGTSQATINLDITDRLTARGSVATDGNTTIGIFYEREY